MFVHFPASPDQVSPGTMRHAMKKPQKPTIISMNPVRVNGRLCAPRYVSSLSLLNRPILGPRLISTPSEKNPATQCTTPAAPKSWNPSFWTIHPSMCHPHALARFHSIAPSTRASSVNPTICILSMTAPENIAAAVAPNIAKAPQNTPDILSSRFGPMSSTHGSAISLAYASPDAPLAPALSVSPVGNAQYIHHPKK